MARKHAFTLVEILVVVAIIALLAALLLPALNGARRVAAAIRCASNMRQIGQAMHLYATANKDFLPIGHFHTNIPLYDRTWDEIIHPEVGGTVPPEQLDQLLFTPREMPLLVCSEDRIVRLLPGFPRSYTMISVGAVPPHVAPNEPTFLGTSGGQYYGGAYFPISHPFVIKRVHVRKPAETLLLAEAHHRYNVAGGQQYFAIHLPHHQHDDPSQPRAPHRGRFNYLFVDGHVAPLEPEETIGNSPVPAVYGVNPGGAWTRHPND